jgi:hypothetical protein
VQIVIEDLRWTLQQPIWGGVSLLAVLALLALALFGFQK